MTMAIYTAFWDSRGQAKRCIASVRNQSDPDWRWYVSADPCAPDTEGLDAIHELAKTDERVALFVRSVSTAPYIGAAKADAFDMLTDETWAIELDCDDWLTRSAVSRFKAAGTKATLAPFIVSSYVQHWPPQSGKPRGLVRPVRPHPHMDLRMLESRQSAFVNGRCYRTDAVRAVGGYWRALTCCEDWHLNVRLWRQFGRPRILAADHLYHKHCIAPAQKRSASMVTEAKALACEDLGVAHERSLAQAGV